MEKNEENAEYQFAPYLAAFQIGRDIHVGGLPPHAGVIQDAPEFLSGLVGFLSAPQPAAKIVGWLVDNGVTEAEAPEVLDQLTAAGFVVPALADPASRYSRHHLYYQSLGLDPIQAQQRLRSATIGLIGTGGIGSNLATLLAAAGVGRLVISDGDTVEVSNLTRQTLYDETVTGRLKVEVAAERLRTLNSETEVVPVPRGFDGPSLVTEHFADCDLIVLSADSPPAIHEWLCATAVPRAIPHSNAGYIEGYAVVGPLVVPGRTACYECVRAETDIFQHVAEGQDPPRLLNPGVQAPSYGPLNFQVAAVQANEAIRYLVGLEPRTVSTRLLIDFADYRQTEERFERDPGCQVCGPLTAAEEPQPERRVLELISEQYERERAEASFNSLLLDPLVAELVPTVDVAATALDVGCGTGDLTRLLADRGYQATGVDLEPAMLRIARERSAGQPVAYREAGLADLDPADGRYDLVLCLNVLDWIEDLTSAFDQLRRLVRPGGELLLSVPHPFKDSGTWARRWNGDRWVYDDFAVTGHYFSEGPVEKSRADSRGETVVARTLTHKRTVETYVRELFAAGFQLTGLYEPAPRQLEEAPVVLVEKSARVPYFLVLRGRVA